MTSSTTTSSRSSSTRLKSRWLFGLTLTALLMAVVSAVAMMILVHPGDECLLFVSVRGEALIYGHPSGCNFITFSQIVAALGAGTLILLLFCRKARTMLSSSASTPSLASSFTMERRRLARLYSTRTMVLAAMVGMLELSAAIVILSGYLVSCNELNYETRRQLYGRTTLGSLPVKNLDMACYSLFRDVDFHTRFHFDHYEYSGQWHGQYRGYRHGRVHHHEVQHTHAINVALALELSMGATWVAAVAWFAALALLLHLRFAKKRVIRKQEENFNNSVAMKNFDEVSNASANSFLFKNNGVNGNPNGAILSRRGVNSMYASHAPSPAPSDSVSQRMHSPMNTSVIVANSNNNVANNSNSNMDNQQVQYVQMSNGVLVPMATLQLQRQQMLLQQQMLQMQQHLQQRSQAGQPQQNVQGQQQHVQGQQQHVQGQPQQHVQGQQQHVQGQPQQHVQGQPQQYVQGQQQYVQGQQHVQGQYQQQVAGHQQQPLVGHQQQQVVGHQQQQVIGHQHPQVQGHQQVVGHPHVPQVHQRLVHQVQSVQPQTQVLQQPLVPQQLNVGQLAAQGSLQRRADQLREPEVDDDDAQRLQLSLSQDFGLKCSQI